MMTMLATGLALVPLIVAGNIAGQEIEYPMGVVILGGLISSTVINLFVVPSLYLRWGKSRAWRAPALRRGCAVSVTYAQGVVVLTGSRACARRTEPRRRHRRSRPCRHGRGRCRGRWPVPGRCRRCGDPGRRGQPREPIEDPLAIRVGHTGPVIGDDELGFRRRPARHLSGRHGDGLGHVQPRVLEEVAHEPGELIGIALELDGPHAAGVDS